MITIFVKKSYNRFTILGNGGGGGSKSCGIAVQFTMLLIYGYQLACKNQITTNLYRRTPIIFAWIHLTPEPNAFQSNLERRVLHDVIYHKCIQLRPFFPSLER
jgi:hypothetical protein